MPAFTARGLNRSASQAFQQIFQNLLAQRQQEFQAEQARLNRSAQQQQNNLLLGLRRDELEQRGDIAENRLAFDTAANKQRNDLSLLGIDATNRAAVFGRQADIRKERGADRRAREATETATTRLIFTNQAADKRARETREAAQGRFDAQFKTPEQSNAIFAAGQGAPIPPGTDLTSQDIQFIGNERARTQALSIKRFADLDKQVTASLETGENLENLRVKILEGRLGELGKIAATLKAEQREVPADLMEVQMSLTKESVAGVRSSGLASLLNSALTNPAVTELKTKKQQDAAIDRLKSRFPKNIQDGVEFKDGQWQVKEGFDVGARSQFGASATQRDVGKSLAGKLSGGVLGNVENAAQKRERVAEEKVQTDSDVDELFSVLESKGFDLSSTADSKRVRRLIETSITDEALKEAALKELKDRRSISSIKAESRRRGSLIVPFGAK